MYKPDYSYCLDCGACCKKYWITLLPKNIKKKAIYLNQTPEEFIKKNCLLYMKLYPSTYEGKLTINTSFLPKKIYEKILTQLNYVPNYLICQPEIVLKRKNGSCLFLQQNNKCKIYSVRPVQCEAFPFQEKHENNKYGFCKIYVENSNYMNSHTEYYQKSFKKYYDKIQSKGFQKTWGNWPKTGILDLNGTEIKIKEKDFLEILQTLKKPEKKHKFKIKKIKKPKIKILKTKLIDSTDFISI